MLEVSFRSHSKVNSLNNALMRELTQLAQQLQFDSELSAIILTGAPDIFSAGMDLKDPEAASASEMTVAEQKEQEAPARPLLVPPTRAPPATLSLFAGKETVFSQVNQQGRH